MMVCTFNSALRRQRKGGFPWIKHQPVIHSEFQDSQGFLDLVSKNQNQKIRQINKQNQMKSQEQEMTSDIH